RSLAIAVTVCTILHREWEPHVRPTRDAGQRPASRQGAHETILGSARTPNQGNGTDMTPIKVRVSIVGAVAEPEYLRQRGQRTRRGVKREDVADVVQVMRIRVRTYELHSAQRRSLESSPHVELQSF